MSKNKGRSLEKEIIRDIDTAVNELREMGFIRDEPGIKQSQPGSKPFEITFHGKSDANHIMLDKYASASRVMNVLLEQRQYTILLYDKSIIQAEYLINNGEIKKERLIFLKKHNRILDRNEISQAEDEGVDWFEEEGIPIFLRIDYDPSSHIDCEHPVAHMTLSNNECCRIPIKDVVSFSEFIRFILHHFYGTKLKMNSYRLKKECTITELEQKMMHISWIE